jgi:hypothetical protein
MWTGLGDNTELFCAVLSQLSFSGASAGATGFADVAGAVGVLAGGLAVPLGYGGSVVCLPPLVRTLNTRSGLVATGVTTDNFD